MTTSLLLPGLVRGVGEGLVEIADSPQSITVEATLEGFRFLASLHRKLFEEADALLVAGVDARAFASKTSGHVAALGRFVETFGQSIKAFDAAAEPLSGDMAQIESAARELWEEARRQYAYLSAVLERAKSPPPAIDWDRLKRESDADAAAGRFKRYDSVEDMLADAAEGA